MNASTPAASGDAAVLYRPCSDVRFRLIDGEAVVLRQSAAEALVLNEVGARILQLLDGATPLAGVGERLLEEFDVDRDELTGDLRDFVARLSAAGVLESVASPTS